MDLSSYASMDPEVFLFVDRRCYPDWEIIRQRIGFHDLTFVVAGQADYYINDRLVTVTGGDLLYIPPGAVRQATTRQDNPMHSYAFNFHIHPAAIPPLPLATVSQGCQTPEIMRYLKEFTQVWMTKQLGHQLQAKGLFLLILHRLLLLASRLGAGAQTDERMAMARAYIADHYAEPLRLETVAELAGLHPVYFSKRFKQDTGTSFKQFVNMVRMNHAEMMLAAGGFRVSEVAERCGFQDISYFSNVFRSLKGYPPSAARKIPLD
ncbi:AraC family transcriptional regulator [Paenibacillus sp. 1P07SE]|uniref:helix-turn-helix transcriptional regulator n=1 Tax=Paenibacillus sp. 1P07SE TaxID=3132209 RepID=UPI0039A76711